MELSKKQADLLTTKVKIKKPCLNCGYDGDAPYVVKALKINPALLRIGADEYDIENVETVYANFTCPNCGFTTLIDLNQLDIL